MIRQFNGGEDRFERAAPFESPLIQNGRFLSDSSRQSPSFSQETDIINPTGITSFLPQQQQQPSESSFSGPLNFSSLPASSSSPLNNSFTIDFTSFTTDTFQQPWLPSPPPHQPQASSLNNNSNNSNNSALEDFVLYPAPPAPAPRPQPQHRDSRVLAASSTAPKPSALQPFLAQNNPRRHSFSLQLQRHLQQQQFSGSPVLDPRVTKLARSHSYWSHPEREALPASSRGVFILA
ncbi:hypothetical protein N7450_003105 [Penicillium hetheringtonii]|uniref:Uncharacterized protein n=1 Tax=Penicillium hetheringtonii TaxID=911720 RepID=A0AAD6DYN2_9EURO|nr:hypothetical protein N7450_003105 [Penicillium hetheringtonii]